MQIFIHVYLERYLHPNNFVQVEEIIDSVIEISCFSSQQKSSSCNYRKLIECELSPLSHHCKNEQLNSSPKNKKLKRKTKLMMDAWKAGKSKTLKRIYF